MTELYETALACRLEATMAGDDSPFVSYTAKEIFEKLDQTLTVGLTQLNVKLDTKASSSDLQRVNDMLRDKADKGDIDKLEAGRIQNRSDIDVLLQWRARVVGVAAGVGAVAGAVGTAISQALS